MKFLKLAVLMFLFIGATQLPGIVQERVLLQVGREAALKVYSDPGHVPARIVPSFLSRNTKVATVDSKGRVRGVAPGRTYVRAKYYNGTCIDNDSVLVIVTAREK